MNQATTVRRRDAADSRERLLNAAGELFAERGYDRTTVREVGLRAGVDPALIARYFGSKAALYLTSLRHSAPPVSETPFDAADPLAVQRLLERISRNGITPTLFAAVRPHEDADLQTAAFELLEGRLVAPAAEQARHVDLDHARLRAEIVTAALAGVVLSRTSGALETLSHAPVADVARLVAQLLGALLEGELPAGAPAGPPATTR